MLSNSLSYISDDKGHSVEELQQLTTLERFTSMIVSETLGTRWHNKYMLTADFAIELICDDIAASEQRRSLLVGMLTADHVRSNIFANIHPAVRHKSDRGFNTLVPGFTGDTLKLAVEAFLTGSEMKKYYATEIKNGLIDDAIIGFWTWMIIQAFRGTGLIVSTLTYYSIEDRLVFEPTKRDIERDLMKTHIYHLLKGADLQCKILDRYKRNPKGPNVSVMPSAIAEDLRDDWTKLGIELKKMPRIFEDLDDYFLGIAESSYGYDDAAALPRRLFEDEFLEQGRKNYTLFKMAMKHAATSPTYKSQDYDLKQAFANAAAFLKKSLRYKTVSISELTSSISLDVLFDPTRTNRPVIALLTNNVASTFSPQVFEYYNANVAGTSKILNIVPDWTQVFSGYYKNFSDTITPSKVAEMFKVRLQDQIDERSDHRVIQICMNETLLEAYVMARATSYQVYHDDIDGEIEIYYTVENHEIDYDEINGLGGRYNSDNLEGLLLAMTSLQSKSSFRFGCETLDPAALDSGRVTSSVRDFSKQLEGEVDFELTVNNANRAYTVSLHELFGIQNFADPSVAQGHLPSTRIVTPLVSDVIFDLLPFAVEVMTKTLSRDIDLEQKGSADSLLALAVFDLIRGIIYSDETDRILRRLRLKLVQSHDMTRSERRAYKRTLTLIDNEFVTRMVSTLSFAEFAGLVTKERLAELMEFFTTPAIATVLSAHNAASTGRLNQSDY
jgi:hypothetical protein